MDVKAVLLVGGESQLPPDAAHNEEPFAGVPLATCDVLGASVLDRVLGRLKAAGVTAVSVLIESKSSYVRAFQKNARNGVELRSSLDGDFWNCAAAQLESMSRGDGVVLVQRLDSYTEVDYERLIEQHGRKCSRITSVVDSEGRAISCLALSPAGRVDAAQILKSRLQPGRTPVFTTKGYSKRLRSIADLRDIAMDALLRRNNITPVGFEIKPGVWAGKGARIHRGARVLAPAYIGVGSRVHAAAVLTRGAVVEHHCEIDCGSVLEGATVLPYSYIGAGLDFVNSVIGFSNIAHLGLGISVFVDDPRFIGMKKMSPLARGIESAWDLLSYLPTEFARTLLRRPARTVPCTLASTTSGPVELNATRSNQSEKKITALTPELVPVRRYGNE